MLYVFVLDKLVLKIVLTSYWESIFYNLCVKLYKSYMFS